MTRRAVIIGAMAFIICAPVIAGDVTATGGNRVPDFLCDSVPRTALPENKARLVDEYCAGLIVREAPPSVFHQPTPVEPTVPTSPVIKVTGIQKVEPPFWARKVYLIRNAWIGGTVEAVAGALFQDQSQGVLVVLDEPGPNTDKRSVYLTPIKVGAVRIIEVSETRLLLESDNGTSFTFELPSRAWVK